MSRDEKISVAITPEMAKIVRDAIACGEFASVSELMSEALRGWKLRRSQRAQAIEELGRLWDEGVESGPAIDGKLAFERLEARLAPGPIDK